MAFYFSKSRYCAFYRCPKLAWLKKYMPEVEVIDEHTQAIFDQGNEVGDLAMGLFGSFVEVTTYDANGKLDLNAMKVRTAEEIAKGTENICEASFDFDGLYCAVDILKKNGDGWDIYEVKSSTEVNDIYIVDVSYQKYVLEKCGLNIINCYVVVIDNTYVRGATLDISKLFAINDVTDEVSDEILNVPILIDEAKKVLACKSEPTTPIGVYCHSPYDCSCFEYCTKDVPSPSVFDLYRMNFKDKVSLYNAGLVDYASIFASGRVTNEKQLRQMDFYLNNRPDYIDKAGIAKFLNTLSYPLYFLDFETMQSAIPPFEGTKPYQQIPFQYSLHYIEYEGGPLLHKEFLGESGTDPRRALAEQLCADIPLDVCTTAYNKSFECSRIKELAEMYPDLADHLLNISDNIKDFLDPFRDGYYYTKDMGGSFSIKVVLPALFPGDPDLDYHKLDQIHNGGEAMTIFPQICKMSPADQKVARENLLKYCCLDTYAMVKIWQKLCDVSQ